MIPEKNRKFENDDIVLLVDVVDGSRDKRCE